MSLKLDSSGGGSITLQEPSTANNRTLALPDTTGAILAMDGSGNTSVTGDLSFNSGFGSAAVAYGVRAWINFSIWPLTGTFSQSASTTVSVSITAHGLTAGQTVNLTFTAVTGVAPASGTYTVTSVTSANAFTVTASVSGTGTGDVTMNYYIRASKNITSLTDNGVGDVTLTFTNAFPDAFYTMGGSASEGLNQGDGGCVISYDMGTTSLTTKTTTQCRINTVNNGADDNIDSFNVELIFVR